jgi:uncharacterized membrane protein
VDLSGAIFAASFILVAAVFSVLPSFSAPDLFFGVTVSPDFAGGREGRSALLRYRAFIWSQGLLTLALLPIAGAADRQIIFVAGVVGQLVGACIAFARAHGAVLPHSISLSHVTIREAELTPRTGLPGGLVAQLGPFVILAAAALYLAAHWDRIPDTFPMHWDFAGRADGWRTRSLDAIVPALLGLGVCGAMAALTYALMRSARAPRQPDLRALNVMAMLAGSYVAAIITGWATIAPVFSSTTLPAPALGIVAAALLLALTWRMIVTVRRLRQRTTIVDTGSVVGDATPDACWKWGQFYNNPQDPALFVPKRVGVGWTLNYGHPWGWPVTMLLIVGPLLAVLAPLFLRMRSR